MGLAPADSDDAATSAGPRELLEALRQRRDELVGLVERLVRAESPSAEPDAQRGPFEILAGELGAAGLAVHGIPGERVGEHLLAHPPGLAEGEPYQLLLGHMDTVWPLGTLEQMPIRLEAGRLHGPGAYDMKGGLAQIAFALQALSMLGRRPDPAPLVFVNTDEEIGSPESTEHVGRLARGASRAFVMEPSFGPRGMLKTARKGVGRFRIRVRGHASHAGINPEQGSSAILEASHQIQRLFELNDPDRGVTVNVGTIGGGLGPNVVAPEVSALVDVRVARAGDAARLERAVRALSPVGTGTEIEVEGGFQRPPLERTARNRALWGLARETASLLGLEVQETLVGGASDGNLTSAHTATLDGLGPVGDGAHAPHEHVIVERLPERAALLAALLVSPLPEGSR